MRTLWNLMGKMYFLTKPKAQFNLLLLGVVLFGLFIMWMF